MVHYDDSDNGDFPGGCHVLCLVGCLAHLEVPVQSGAL